MAGYGNRQAPDLAPSDLEHEHTNTRFSRDSDTSAYVGGHDTYGSAATAGPGFGNKHSSSSSESTGYDNSEFRFGSHSDTKPYTGATKHGSGTIGGAGFGNKTGSFESSNDSTVGKLMEKAGQVLHKEGLADKGRAKREEQGFGQNE